ncbi:galactokinase [Clostridium acetobutylicum]|uniref:Galactokinase n=1 Tax=Clostridium acetobutylicum (strain ATCC 824 / DSM 792 / JCM 1419 / IAM 19013 / LMG 5710 / NBRC 13948 / NRRL B-527 / VKM B-1787 / 2291 / W) TaxID=272562 RepID=GAL1_CLOAB|nr:MULTISPECIES: galactokinase [Clostridium]Q97EZ6.1 RecName: Full=Galactokinase; AltName: Full=Galactose kinase [Clostridium acetobutylicum ATCC 824]AAK80901.1 Galactokinase [Clostridium acetobutylicum ATCC 824]ADZ22003.1 galactokinase [Clostridium acetobutylicum EA 2018]AEI34124.1 galactokinase [Clostridium acetobutylicum DSM 1731]AWV78687.1 galactokinase [Clostridium acetobutylicum]MBC2393550.1 galactokinase [Clostridium acetobutylicum]
MDIINMLDEKFKNIFKRHYENVFFSPGRVNLIGEHTDYNGGHVFPCALTIGTYGLVARRNDNKVLAYSLNFDNLGVIEFSLDDLKKCKKDDWANYVKGVIDTFNKHGHNIENGFEILFYGSIPNGSGLSSSASIEVLTGIILNDLFKLNINMVEIVKMCQEAENSFIGVNCGIMDQFSIGMGKKDCAILLDCSTLEYSYSKLNMTGYKIVIANTNKKRGLADSKYNERRSECEAALKELQKVKNINSLGELTEAEFEELKDIISDPVKLRRARHAVYENQRTLKAVVSLNNNDLKTFGKLMNESHISLRDDYEVTGIELDTLVSLALESKGVIGSRMTGAGFGGCTVSIVKEDYVDEFIESIKAKYTEKIGYEPSFYIVNIADGAKKIN